MGSFKKYAICKMTFFEHPSPTVTLCLFFPNPTPPYVIHKKIQTAAWNIGKFLCMYGCLVVSIFIYDSLLKVVKHALTLTIHPSKPLIAN